MENFESNPQVLEATSEASALVLRLQSFSLANAEQYSEAGIELTRIKGQRKRLDDLRKSLTSPLDEAKKRIMDFFRPPTERLDSAEATMKRAMVAFSDAQERAQRAEQARLDMLARKEREESERKAAEARIKAEAQAAELRVAAMQAELEGRGAESAKLSEQAERKIERAEERAQAHEQSAAMNVAPIAQREAPKVEGISFRDVAKFAIENEALIPREYLLVDESKIRRVVLALKLDAKIPGIRIWLEKQATARAAS